MTPEQIKKMAQAAVDFWSSSYELIKTSFYTMANGRFPDSKMETPELFKTVLLQEYIEKLSDLWEKHITLGWHFYYCSSMDYSPCCDHLRAAVKAADMKNVHLPEKEGVCFSKDSVVAWNNNRWAERVIWSV